MDFAKRKSIGWRWAAVVWLYSLITYLPLDILKFITTYSLSKGWNNLFENKIAFSTKKNYGREEREAQWAVMQRTRHGLQNQVVSEILNDKNNNYEELSKIAEMAKKRAEMTRLQEISTLKGHTEAMVRRNGLDMQWVPLH